ncbi:hypothetical protein BX600DRAFT_434313 [Xylariales sp. PMI_506]|nr:hypothetical protein BX600DRAFT_434313 [Xylariales sp. PMI_506]
MLSTFPPMFTFNSQPQYQPAVSSPLSSSSPIRASQSSPPLSPLNPNTLPRREYHSSPSAPIFSSPSPSTKLFKYAGLEYKKNPLKQNRESANESRRKLFLKNVRQRADDKQWERRGGDQEVLKLEWVTLNHQRRLQKDSDMDGLIFEDDLDDALVENQQPDDMLMTESYALQEEAELDAMLSMYEAESQPQTHTWSQQTTQSTASPWLSDDEEDYDGLFIDILSQQSSPQQHQATSSEDITLSGQMDMS